jgi:hypothetical protein
MWTPKRVLLLGLGALVFLVGYGIYAFFLGAIDGMPPLPEDFFPGPLRFIESTPQSSDVDEKLIKAFGPKCPQLSKRIKFEVRKKHLAIAASEISTSESDGRVKLTDFACAMFKENMENKESWPEITTVTSDFAFLTFDQPITNALDMNKAKLIGGELRSKDILIVNNRGNRFKNDDLEILVSSEPLFYDEASSRIWSEGYVDLIDKKTHPDPTRVKGQGLEILLTKDSAPDKKETARAKPRTDGLSGVDTIILKSTVRMDLYPEATSGFMTVTAPPQDAGSKAKALDRSHVVITTPGQFLFDVAKDVAHFSTPVAKGDATYPEQVEVIRELLKDPPDEVKDGKKYDRMLCDHLTLKFKRKNEPGPKSDKGSGDREIDSAHATARPGMEVTVSLDTENLAAYCSELFYESPTPDRGARTLLRGNPVEAVKDGHKIKCPELCLEAANQKGVGQRVVAKGPGMVDLFDKDPNKGYTTHAIWKGLLTQTKYKEGERDLDLLTLTEDAVFVDDEHSQKLWGQRLQVWLKAAGAPEKSTPAEKDSANGGPHQQVEKVEAYERVKADGPEFRIKEAISLKIRIKDATSLVDSLPAPGSKEDGALPPGTTGPGNVAPSQTPGAPAPSAPVGPTAKLPAQQTAKDDKKDEKPKQPIDLWAKDVIIDVLRSGDKNDLQELVALGNVHVHQDGEKPEDKGVDIKGETLDLLHFADGDILKVFGSERGEPPAQLQLGDLFLQGPQVTIDQRANTAAVEGLGLMRMPSKTTFDGSKAAKPGTTMTIHWTRNMFFDGQNADFNGGITAYQDDSALRSATLQVALDKKVSLKEGQKSGNEAKVDKLVAHDRAENPVWILDVAKDEKDPNKITSMKRLTGNQVAVDNTDSRVNTTGPGTVTILQYSSEDGITGGGPKQSGPKQSKQPGPAKTPQLMLTRVDFQDRLFSAPVTGSTTTRLSKFYGNVLVVHVPADNLDAKVDTSKLPKGGMLVQCGVLTVTSKKMPDETTKQEMCAQDRVVCWSGTEMYARASKAKFDDFSNIVIFEGTPGNPAILSKIEAGRVARDKDLVAMKIRYNRETGLADVEGGSSIRGWLAPQTPADEMVALAGRRE